MPKLWVVESLQPVLLYRHKDTFLCHNKIITKEDVRNIFMGDKIMMKLRNFTPHSLVFESIDGTRTEFASEGSIRILTETVTMETVAGMQTVSVIQKTEETVLPEPETDTFFIVSGMVREAFPERQDFISPCTDPKFVIRDDQGRVEAVMAWQI